MFEDQRYDESLQTLTAALLRPGVSKDDRIQIHRYLAYNYIALSRLDEAESAVRGLYALNPSFALQSNESPRFRDFFAAVKKRWDAEGRPGLVSDTSAAPQPKAVVIRHVSPAEREHDQEIILTGQLDDPEHRSASVRVHYRTGTEGKFTEVQASFESVRFRASIPPAAVQPPLLEYYIEIHDSSGLPIATRGDASAPLRIPIPAEDRSLFASPWFWTGTTAAIVGGVLAGVLLSSKKSESSQPSSGAHLVVTVGP
jgi:hypothetical protein